MTFFLGFTNGGLQPLPVIPEDDMQISEFGDETGENAIAQPVGNGSTATMRLSKLAMGAAAIFLVLLT